MVSIAMANATFYGEKHNLVNMLRSLVPMQPDEVNIADTSRTDAAAVEEFHKWLYARGEEYGLPIKITWKPFDGWYSRAHNRALDMCTSDWTLVIGSDEMLSLQCAHDVREYLAGVPPHILAVRFRLLDLLDDTTCRRRNLWPPGKRRNSGAHARMFRTGVGCYTAIRTHERLDYPGRTTIPFNSPGHPLADWNGGYAHCLLHLYSYKDNIMRRKIVRGFDLHKMPLDVSPERACEAARQIWLERRGFKPAPVPEGVTWVPIIWKLEPEKWALRQEDGAWLLRNYYGQGGR